MLSVVLDRVVQDAGKAVHLADSAYKRFIQMNYHLDILMEILERKGLLTREEFKDVFKELVIDPENERQAAIMEGQRQCPNRCPHKQPLLSGEPFDHARCQSVWEHCPIGMNPNSNPIEVLDDPPPETPLMDDVSTKLIIP